MPNNFRSSAEIRPLCHLLQLRPRYFPTELPMMYIASSRGGFGDPGSTELPDQIILCTRKAWPHPESNRMSGFFFFLLGRRPDRFSFRCAFARNSCWTADQETIEMHVLIWIAPRSDIGFNCCDVVYYVGCRKTNTDQWSMNCRTFIRFHWCYSYSHPSIARRQDCTSLYFRGMPTNDILATVPTHRRAQNYLLEFRSMQPIKTIGMKYTWCDGPLGLRRISYCRMISAGVTRFDSSPSGFCFRVLLPAIWNCEMISFQNQRVYNF